MSRTVISGASVSIPDVSNHIQTSQSVTSNTTLTYNADIVYIGTLTANITITLPALSSVYTGKIIKFIMTDLTTAFTYTVQRAGTDTFEDATTSVTIYRGHIDIASHNSTWVVMKGRRHDQFNEETVTLATTTALTVANSTVYVGTLTGNITLTLPAVTTVPNGKTVKFVMTNLSTAFYYQITCAGADTFNDATTWLRVYSGHAEVMKYNSTWVVLRGKKYAAYGEPGHAAGNAYDLALAAATEQTSNFCGAPVAGVLTFAAGVNGRYNIDAYARVDNLSAAGTMTLTATNSAATATYGTLQSRLERAGAAEAVPLHLSIRNVLLLAAGTLKLTLTMSGAVTAVTLATANNDYALYIEKID